MSQKRDLKMKNLLFFTVKTCLFTCLLLCLFSFSAFAQETNSASGKTIYDQIKNFNLNGGKAEVTGLSLKRDRAAMAFQSGSTGKQI
jgi:hypothetical protein